MKRNWFYAVLAAEAIVCILLGLLQMQFSGMFTAIAAFPFEQAGMGLRRLSLSGTAGNVLAIVLYCLFSLLPCGIYVMLRRKRREKPVDILLPGLSVLLFAVNYYMVNPGLLQTGQTGAGKWLPGSVFYSVLFGYLVLRLLSVYSKAQIKKLQQGLYVLLGFLNMIFVYAVCGREFSALLTAIRTVQDGNSAFAMDGNLFSASPLTFTYIFLVLRFLVNALPYLLDIAVVFLAARVLKELEKNRYSETAVTAVQKLADFCAVSLGIAVSVEMAFNVLQFLCSGRLYQMDFTVYIPVVPVVFVLAVLLLAKYVREDQKLKQEHDLFI